MTYQEALNAGDLLARFIDTQLDRFTPGLDHTRAYTNARKLGMTAAQLGRQCALNPLAVRLQLTA